MIAKRGEYCFLVKLKHIDHIGNGLLVQNSCLVTRKNIMELWGGSRIVLESTEVVKWGKHEVMKAMLCFHH